MKKTARAILSGFVLSLTSLSPAFAQTTTVDLSSAKQSIRGFGGINHPVWIADLTAEQRELAFGNGPGQVGMTILRIHVDENSSQWSKELPTALRAQELGATIFASPWNPPSSMAVNVSGQQRVDPTKYAQYAQHLNDFTKYLLDNGVDLYAISMQNEPDYAEDWTEWSPSEVVTFMKNYAGTPTTRVIAPESFQYRKPLSDPLLNDADALANLDILGAHLYGTQLNQFPYPLWKQKGGERELWMTEVYTDSTTDADVWPSALEVAYNIHNSMVEAEFNVYTWWYIRRSYGLLKENGEVSKRGYCMAQFSKFVRPGFVRVDATKSPTNNLYVSAYKSDSSVVVVALNRSGSAQSLTIDIPGTNIAAFERYTTSSSKSLLNEGEVAAVDGKMTISLDAQSVSTLVGVDPDFQSNPEPDPSGTGGTAGIGGIDGGGGTSLTGAGGQVSGGTSNSATDEHGSGTGGAILVGASGGDDASAGADELDGSDFADQAGCSCRIERNRSGGSLLLWSGFFLLGMLLRRRRTT